MPSAPPSSALATSPGSSILACSAISTPSRVDRLRRLQTLELGAFELDLAFSEPILVENARIGVDDQHAARAVDNQVFVVVESVAGH
jgi:hypothetical protein